MEILFQNITIIDPGGKFNGKKTDVLVRDGKIEKITNKIKPERKTKVLQLDGSCISPGWIDVGCGFGEPGNEHRETLESLVNCAQFGGYTQILPFGNTKPGIHGKTEIEFIKSKTKGQSVIVHPIGYLTRDNKGVEMTEFMQMKMAGALAFSDGNAHIADGGVFKRLLEYTSQIPESCIIHHSFDEQLCTHGQVHEGNMSIQLGLRGIPGVAEKLAIQKELEILKYAGGQVVFHKISTQDGVQLIRRHKKEGLAIHASVSIFNLIFEDKDLATFDTHLKLLPPLRNKSDKKALWAGLEDDTIDIICSDHCPWDPEKKDLEFQSAAFGSINLETAFSLSQFDRELKMPLDLWVKKVSHHVRKVFNLPSGHIIEGQVADITWFHPELRWKYDTSLSLSKNTRFLGHEMKGKVLGTFSQGRIHVNQ